MAGHTVFLLSPANTAGKRARAMLERRDGSSMVQDLAARGVPIGEVFSFLSGLYFRGKRVYAERFGVPPPGYPGALVIVPGRGLVGLDVLVSRHDLEQMAAVRVDPDSVRFVTALREDATRLGAHLCAEDRVVLLGSIATEKYVEPLLEVLGSRLWFPEAFAGRGDMSRGGLLLRCAAAGRELRYVRTLGASRHGPRPPRLSDSTLDEVTS